MTELDETVRAVALDVIDELATATLFAELPIVHHVFVSAAQVGSGALDAPTDACCGRCSTRGCGARCSRLATPRQG